MAGSDVTTYKVLGTTIIVLNSREAIEALFEKEVEQYSSKPPRRMANMYVSPPFSPSLPRAYTRSSLTLTRHARSSDLTMTLPFMDPGEVFSTARKQFWTGIGPSESCLRSVWSPLDDWMSRICAAAPFAQRASPRKQELLCSVPPDLRLCSLLRVPGKLNFVGTACKRAAPKHKFVVV